MPLVFKKNNVVPESTPTPSDKLKGKFLELPDRLSHYTTLSGMVGIIENCELWASNVSFLNDQRELLHGLEAAESVVRKFSSQKAYGEWNKSLKAAVSRLEEGEIPNTYAACFCEGPDLLSQWRAYGGTEQGVAITFDRVKLVNIMKIAKANLLPVVYGKLQTNKQITKELSDKLDELDKEGELLGGYGAKEKIQKAYSLLSRLLPQFKHIGFKEEREWRLVVQQYTLRASVSFRPKTNVLVPYIKLPLGDKQDLPILSIRISPGRDQELTKRSVELYLRSKGQDEKIRVRLSRVPYRV